MKEHITPHDLKGLTVAQRESLRSLWLPEKNDLAVASICTNVETDEYDDIEFVVGEVIIKEQKMMHHHMILRRLRLVDEPEADVGDDETADDSTGRIVGFPERNSREDSDESEGIIKFPNRKDREDSEESDGEQGRYDEDGLSDEEEPFIPYIEPEQYFNIEDCLPLLSIGQMMGILRKSKVGQNGMEIYIPPDTNKILDRRLFTLSDNEGEAFENEELCDLLWDALKSVI